MALAGKHQSWLWTNTRFSAQLYNLGDGTIYTLNPQTGGFTVN